MLHVVLPIQEETDVGNDSFSHTDFDFARCGSDMAAQQKVGLRPKRHCWCRGRNTGCSAAHGPDLACRTDHALQHQNRLLALIQFSPVHRRTRTCLQDRHELGAHRQQQFIRRCHRNFETTSPPLAHQFKPETMRGTTFTHARAVTAQTRCNFSAIQFGWVPWRTNSTARDDQPQSDNRFAT